MGIIVGENGQDISHSGISKWYDSISEAFEISGRGIQGAQYHARLMKEAGFEEVHEEIFDWPVNTWPRDKAKKVLGLWSREHMADCLEAWSILPLTQFLGWSPEEVHILNVEARRSLWDKSIRANWKM